MKARVFAYFITVIFLGGCAAAMVPNTSDPYKKLENAQYLLHDGRPIPAERLTKQALSDFEKDQDIFGQAETHHFLGIFYKSLTYKNDKFFQEDPSYDPTSKTSIRHFEIAVDRFKQEGDMWGASKSLFEMANAYAMDGNSTRQCELFDQSLRTYESGTFKPDSRGRMHIHTINPNFKDMPEMIQRFKTKYCSGK